MLSICLILIVGILYCSAYDNLSRRKYTNQHRHWTCVPSSCQQYASHNAIDENTNTCTRTDTIMAYAGSYTWWYVDFGEVKSISYIRIKFKSYSGHEIRQRGRFAGFSLYLSNTTDKEDGYRCYIDGPELPPLDFNTTCIGHARYVIYYNERLPEGQYLEGYADGYPEGFQLSSITELCDVDVQGNYELIILF
ncbi:uncharacterized protein LOC134258299 [Saccostrea cucullata]|uniref:uncharacterized protein LOC134258299 n=1 Tax=Saccostrea cuccullata TaxID=36930 RepID=UPI002ED245BE